MKQLIKNSKKIFKLLTYRKERPLSMPEDLSGENDETRGTENRAVDMNLSGYEFEEGDVIRKPGYSVRKPGSHSLSELHSFRSSFK